MSALHYLLFLYVLSSEVKGERAALWSGLPRAGGRDLSGQNLGSVLNVLRPDSQAHLWETYENLPGRKNSNQYMIVYDDPRKVAIEDDDHNKRLGISSSSIEAKADAAEIFDENGVVFLTKPKEYGRLINKLLNKVVTYVDENNNNLRSDIREDLRERLNSAEIAALGKLARNVQRARDERQPPPEVYNFADIVA